MYVGIDVGKRTHVAGLVSTTLLKRHSRFEQCPSLSFAQSREGFESLLDFLTDYTLPHHCVILLENTGHYHRPLLQYLREAGMTVYMMHVVARPSRMLKSDKRDALTLANHVYNQIEKEVQVADKRLCAHKVCAQMETAAFLHSLVRHRYELQIEATQRKNKLTSIADEIFPELTSVWPNPNLPAVLLLRAAFPTPVEVALAPVAALTLIWPKAAGVATRAKFERVRGLAENSIGTTEPGRRRGLALEQGQLIKELQLIEEHLSALDGEIATAIAACRQGKILTSLPMIGSVMAANLLAAIGTIDQFESAARLKAYLGWGLRASQTGSTLDSTALSKHGLRTTKQGLYLVVLNAIHADTEWRDLYQRLVPKKCAFDARTGVYRGRKKVIGRICGQLVEMIYMLLRRDADLVAKALASGEEPGDPQLYDRAIHHAHRTGSYRPAAPNTNLAPRTNNVRYLKP